MGDTAQHPERERWFSEYDGVTISASSGVDIDHVVPLAEAWRSGASSWTTSRRQSFANDVDELQLIAVSASSNRSKGDEDPSTWQPTRTSYHCTYAKAVDRRQARLGPGVAVDRADGASELARYLLTAGGPPTTISARPNSAPALRR